MVLLDEGKEADNRPQRGKRLVGAAFATGSG